MKTIQTNSNTIKSKALALLLLTFFFLFGIHSAHAVQVSLGSLTLSNPTASYSFVDSDPSLTIDGNYGGFGDGHGWRQNNDTGVAHWVQWEVDTPEITLNPGQSEDYLTMALTLYWGGNTEHLPSSYTMSYSSDSAGSFTTFNNYNSITNTSPDITLTVDADGTINVSTPTESTDPDHHTLNMNYDRAITHIRLDIPAFAGHNSAGNVILSEIEGTATAEVIPEPSTYALMAGLVSLVWVARRKMRKNA